MNSIFAWLEASRNWLETESRWSKLRDLGQSGMVRSSILMPVFGYLLLFNEDVRQYLRIGYDAAWPFTNVGHQTLNRRGSPRITETQGAPNVGEIGIRCPLP